MRIICVLNNLAIYVILLLLYDYFTSMNKQILEEPSDAKFLCASFHVNFINCCRSMVVEEYETSQIVARKFQNVSEQIFYSMNSIRPIFKMYMQIF